MYIHINRNLWLITPTPPPPPRLECSPWGIKLVQVWLVLLLVLPFAPPTLGPQLCVVLCFLLRSGIHFPVAYQLGRKLGIIPPGWLISGVISLCQSHCFVLGGFSSVKICAPKHLGIIPPGFINQKSGLSLSARLREIPLDSFSNSRT